MKETEPVKYCIMCAKDKRTDEVTLVQVLPATWNSFNNFAEVCAECQGSRRFQVWAKSIKPKAKAAAAVGSESGSLPAVPSGEESLPPATVQVAHRRTGELLHTVASHTLAGADLCGAALCGADLHDAALRGADLHRADLHLADLTGADLRGADLRAVNLRGADLRGADLREARLHRADLNHSVYDRETLWPSGFDPLTSGAGIGRTG